MQCERTSDGNGESAGYCDGFAPVTPGGHGRAPQPENDFLPLCSAFRPGDARAASADWVVRVVALRLPRPVADALARAVGPDGEVSDLVALAVERELFDTGQIPRRDVRAWLVQAGLMAEQTEAMECD